MKKLYFLAIALLETTFVIAQCNGRYQAEIFTNVSVSTVNYSDVYLNSFHEMDVYMPDGDTVTNRPFILYMHGGSFSAGTKNMTDCVDFCTSMAKRGYVSASINYRLELNALQFALSNTVQYETVLKSVADAKAAIRFMRKDYVNGDTYGIDPNTIFVGGFSAGGVIAIHLAYINSISDLPTSPIDVQTIMNNNGGFEGDAGNNGYSSQVSGVYSFAGGINDLGWIDASDAPIVSIHGTDDQIVNYNCGPGLNIPTVLNLCGAAAIHPIADNVGIFNDKLIFNGTDHNWGLLGTSNSKFTQAIDFTTDFLYNLLPCNQTTSIFTLSENDKKLLQIVDVLGKEVKGISNTPLFYIYDDGSVDKKVIIEY